MALTYDLSKCAAWNKDEETKEAEWEVTQGMIFQTMSVGLGSITEKNEAIFYARQYIWNMLNKFTPFTPEQVHSYVGLKTNVGDETDAAWRKRTMENATWDATRYFKLCAEKALDKQ